MFDRIKRVLVKSFVGVIALGYLLALVTQYFVAMFTTPLAEWAGRNLYRGLVSGSAASLNQPLRAALSPAMTFILLFLIWYILLRWLFFTPVKDEVLEPNPERAD